MTPRLPIAQSMQEELFRSMRETLRHEAPDPRPEWQPWLLAGAIIFVAAWAGQRIWRRMQAWDDPTLGPIPLFRAAMRATPLGLSERLLLTRLARTNEIRHPAALLLGADYFAEQVEIWLQKVQPGRRRARAERRLQRVAAKLFVAGPSGQLPTSGAAA